MDNIDRHGGRTEPWAGQQENAPSTQNRQNEQEEKAPEYAQSYSSNDAPAWIT